LKIQNRISGEFNNLAVPGRRFMREGSMIKISERVPTSLFFYLFSDILVFTTHAHRNFKGMISLERAKIIDIKDTDKFKNAFIISTPIKEYRFLCHNKGSKEDWIRDISSVINNLTEKTKDISDCLQEFSMFPTRSPRSSHKTSPIKQGYMFKQGGMMRNWRKRWIVLENGVIYYYNTKNYGPKDEPKTIILSKYYLQELEQKATGKSNCFHLYSQEAPSFVFCAPSKEAMVEWVTAIRSFTMFGKNCKITESNELISISGIFEVSSNMASFQDSFPSLI